MGCINQTSDRHKSKLIHRILAMAPHFKAPWEREVAPFCPYDDENVGHDGYHSQVCPYRRFQCPYDRCNFSGPYTSRNVKETMIYHLRANHGDRFKQSDEAFQFRLDGVTEAGDRTWLRFFNSKRKYYIVRICKESDRFFFDVQLVGYAWQTLELDCSISLLAAEEGTIATATWGGIPRSVREEPDICLEINLLDVIPYIHEEQLNILIAITKRCKDKTQPKGKQVHASGGKPATQNASKSYKTARGRIVQRVNYGPKQMQRCSIQKPKNNAHQKKSLRIAMKQLDIAATSNLQLTHHCTPIFAWIIFVIIMNDCWSLYWLFWYCYMLYFVDRVIFIL